METQREIPGIFTGMLAVIRRDLLLAWKRPGDMLNPLFFFAMVSTLFPLGTAPAQSSSNSADPACCGLPRCWQ